MCLERIGTHFYKSLNYLILCSNKIKTYTTQTCKILTNGLKIKNVKPKIIDIFGKCYNKGRIEFQIVSTKEKNCDLLYQRDHTLIVG